MWDQVISWYGKKLTIYLCELTYDMCMWYIYVGLSIFPWTCIERKNSYSPWRMTSSCDRHQVQVQEEHLEDLMLEACRPFGDYGQVKICLREALPYWCMGEHYVSLHQAKRNQERWSNLRRSRSSSSSSSGLCARQRYDLDRFSILPVSRCVGRPGYRIDNRSIKRGSRMVTWSYRS